MPVLAQTLSDELDCAVLAMRFPVGDQFAIDLGEELRVPLLIASLTTAAAFLPIYLAKSTAGEYTGITFIVVGLVFTLLFVSLIWGVVSLVLYLAT